MDWRAFPLMASQFLWPPSDYCAWLGRCARRGDVVCMSVTRSTYFINDPALLRIILQADGTLVSKQTTHYQRFANAMGHGMVTESGAVWQAARARCGDAFWPKRIALCDTIIGKHVHAWHLDWRHQAVREGVVDVSHQVAWRLFALNAELLFGVVLNEEEASQWFATMTSLTEQTMSHAWLLSGVQRKKLAKAQRSLDDWLWSIRFCIDASDALLAPIAKAVLTGALDRDAYLGEIKNILFASYDTTTCAMGWGLHALATHQGVQHALCHRLADDLEASAASGLWLYQHCLPIRHLIAETLRLYPSAFGLERRLDQVPTELVDRFKPGTVVHFSPYWLHRHPRYWMHPHAFYPDRFLKPVAHRYAYMPFLLGPRNCIGQHLSNTIMAKCFFTWLRDIQFLPSGQAVACLPRLTLRPKAGIPLRLVLRAKSMLSCNAQASKATSPCPNTVVD